MTYKHFYWTIIFRLAILVLIAGLTTYLFLQKDLLLGDRHRTAADACSPYGSDGGQASRWRGKGI